MRISDWSSDVCSSDLVGADIGRVGEIAFAAMFKDRAVDPGARRVYPPPVDPFTPHRVDAAILEDEDRAMLVVLDAARGRRIIEKPFAVETMHMGRPDSSERSS